MEEKFLNEGLYRLPKTVDTKMSKDMLNKIKSTRVFGKDLFLKKEDYTDTHLHVNPKSGKNNLLESFDGSLGFIEDDPAITNVLNKILGKDYCILLKKIVCGVPTSWIPEWIQNSTRNRHVNNLGAYIKPEYRDITYFHGIDMHQDIIDFAGNVCDFITLYVYLDDVTSKDAPLYVVPGSFRFGATSFPHNINNLSRSSCVYENTEMPVIQLTGVGGSVALWHACTLHGTQPTDSDSERISLRYLIKKGKNANDCLIDKINNKIKGQLKLTVTRNDLDPKGIAIKKGNKINDI